MKHSRNDLQRSLSKATQEPSPPSVMLRLVDWANDVQHKHVSDFFETLVRLFRELFRARMVTIWDYTPDNESLVLQASTPERTSRRASYVIPVKKSMTGRILTTAQIETQDVTSSADGRTFASPELATELGLKTMYSVPIFKSGTRQVRLILNLCYGENESLPLPKSDLQLLSDFIAICLEHRLYTRGVHIREDVASVAATAAGIRSLFESIEEGIKGRTHAQIAQILRVSNGVLIEEGRSATPDGNKKLTAEEIAAMQKTCVTERQVYMERIAEGDRFDCRVLAVPFLSATDKPIAVLCCKEPVAASGRVRAFSSIDLHALQTFVQMLSPSVERFSRLEQGRSLAIIRRVARALEGGDSFEQRLHRVLQELCRALEIEIASIYLRVRDKPDEFVMRAAYGRNESLVGEARYRIGEGMTGGVLETGAIVNLRDDTELNTTPRWTGKYDDPIWGGDARAYLKAFLAVPIQSESRPIGVLKLANIRASSAHTDSFFTDEDVQLVRVIVSFLAHAVRNDETDQQRLLQFRLLAQASLDLQAVNSEEEAITVLLSTLEKSSVAGARVILNSAESTQPFQLGFGILDAVHRHKVIEWEAEDSPSETRRVNVELNGRRYGSYIFPIEIDKTRPGFLQVVPPSSAADPNSDLLTLRAFSGQFEAAIARVRLNRHAQDLADEAVTRHRFVAAETVYLAAVHRLGHTLDAVLKNLELKLKDPHVRGNRLALEETTALKNTIEQLKNELKSSLNIVRAQDEATYDVHTAITTGVRRWNADRTRRCKATLNLQATRTVCRLNPDAIQEILNIILVNSEQAHARSALFTTHNDDRVEIERSEGEPLYIHSAFCLEIHDDGPGIAPDLLEEVFSPVFTSKPQRFGTGLGLFIARMLARRGGGELKAHRSRNSKGALFRLTLPTFEVNV